jgi:predicted nucleotidyltransferase
VIDPAIAPLVAVARALGSLTAEVVFIGGAIAPLLQADPPFPRVRPTVDVDGMVASATYGDVERLHERLRARGFREQVSARHVHRWLAPDSTPFDLVPIGDHLGGTGNPHDVEVAATAVRHELERGLTIRHASAAGFLALKWGAFDDRGRRDPLASHDLEDILALVASRPGVVEEMRTAPPGLRALVAEWSGWLLATEYAEDLLASHLNNATDVGATVKLVRERIAGMAPGEAA